MHNFPYSQPILLGALIKFDSALPAVFVKLKLCTFWPNVWLWQKLCLTKNNYRAFLSVIYLHSPKIFTEYKCYLTECRSPWITAQLDVHIRQFPIISTTKNIYIFRIHCTFVINNNVLSTLLDVVL